MRVLVLTGAGISAESGIPTFRDADGLWEGHRFEDVATPEAFTRNPELVHKFYNDRRRALQSESIVPNAAHHALANFEARLMRESSSAFLLVTQNIDNLHQRAGSKRILPMHGELLKVRCLETDDLYDWTEDLNTDTPHPKLDSMPPAMRERSRLGWLRPHVVWFGEMPIGMQTIESAARTADLFVAIGTSAAVYPAAGIVQMTSPECRKVQLNLESTSSNHAFDETILGPATKVVPKFFDSIQIC